MKMITKKMIEAAARAIERHYHREMGPCSEKDGYPNCWKSMIGFAKVGLTAAILAQRKASGGKKA